MKRISISPRFRILLLLLGFIILIAASCKKMNLNPGTGDEDPYIPEADNNNGQITPAGEVLETAVTVTIGASGGALQSADGRLRITVPAGAVTTDRVFSIQRITNTNIAGTGAAYRLQPHGVPFAKPVTLSFAYDTLVYEGTVPEAVGIAYQDEKGIWWGQGAVKDATAKTLSVSTTHFSDWSLFEAFTLYPASGAVNLAQTLNLNVYNNMSDELAVPPVPGTLRPIGPQQDVTAQYIKEWKLGGAGTLTPIGSEAVYTAPASMPARNPVAVSVALKGPDATQYLLVSNIYIGPEGVTFRIDNGPWLHGTIPLGVVLAQGIHNLDAAVVSSGNNGPADAAFSLKWRGYPSGGHLNWGDSIPWFLYQPPGNTAYQQFIVAGKVITPSAGGIDFSRYTETPGGIITGSFTLERAGKRVLTGTSATWTPVKIEGYFRTKRVAPL
ncbi:hypothetical protein [Niabella drilacis]|uniref:ZU5 domain-containing protein n=1 Tax=Niabella drilacis (strain DSM 25811 / CCM 8410 / CCUG 62505 / LMG 26954 / E90) TaxID=1285928 RepID=A0A1G6ZU71_NIADE|nr:hypothetical protein [Niabella drilacis]SDE06092.1 hypothetical protein SAMN04487894_11965 [Niabella drilacis]